MLLAINHGVNYGLGKTVYSCLGNLFGNLLLAFISIIGLGAILIASSLVFNIIKWVGIIYLIFIGLKLIISQRSDLEIIKNPAQLKKDNKSKYRLFLEGFMIAIGNPKGILFFTALFPQFIDMNSSSVSTFLVVFMTLAFIAFVCYMLYAILGENINSLLQVHSFRKKFDQVTGLFFICTGTSLIFTKK